MRVVYLIGLSALATAEPAVADVILPGPPVVPIRITPSQDASMIKAARSAVSSIFNFSLESRPDYLDDAYRAAGKTGMTSLDRILTVTRIGDRVFVLAVAKKFLRSQTIGEVYTYLQCRFGEDGQVLGIDVDL